MLECCRISFFIFFMLMVTFGCDRTVVKNGQSESSADSTDPTQLITDNADKAVVMKQPPALGDNSGTVAETASNSQPSVEKRFVSVQPVKSEDPIKMLQHLTELDRAIQDLLVTSRQMEPQASREAAVQLSQLKLEAGQHLSQLPTASSEQSLAGMRAQLVALSHLSGLKDVQAARKLEELARTLLQHPNAELRHQAQVVLFGFQIQNLQNGVLTDAAQLVQSARELLLDPGFRTRLEMTSITHALNVLYQMGFTEEASELEKASFQAFSDSYDRELRYEAWNQLTRQSPYLQNFLTSLKSIQDASNDSGPVLAAARGLIQEYPNSVTLEMIAGIIPDVEYGGKLQLSTELTRLVDTELPKYTKGTSVDAIAATLAEHRQRLAWLDRKLELPELLDAEGKGLELSSLDGKVVLIDFWATWCMPCLQELPNLRQVFDELSGKGFAILSINMDQDAERLKQFLRDQRLPWPTYRPADGDTKSITDQFGITLFPHTMLMNRQGKIVSLHVRGPEVQKQAEHFLQQEF